MAEKIRLDLSNDPRQAHILYFSRMANPYGGMTVNVDVTEFLQKVKANCCPFFLTLLHCVAKAANAVPEMRRRLEGTEVVEYSSCDTSHTVLLTDGSYRYCRLNHDMDFEQYLTYAIRRQEDAKNGGPFREDGDPNEVYFISCLPWISYTNIVQPTPFPPDSNPRITWGRYFDQGGRSLIPVTLLCNHALADGLHMARFYQELDRQLAELL